MAMVVSWVLLPVRAEDCGLRASTATATLGRSSISRDQGSSAAFGTVQGRACLPTEARRRSCAAGACAILCLATVKGNSFGGLTKEDWNFAINQRRRIRVRFAATQGGGEDPEETARRRRTLEQLDRQLKLLANPESSAPRNRVLRSDDGIAADGEKVVDKSAEPLQWPDSSPGFLADGKKGVDQNAEPLQWPDFSPEFLAFTSFVLFLLTVVTNTLFQAFFNPQPIPRDQYPKTLMVPKTRFGVASFEQGNETKEVQEQARKQWRKAPTVTSE